MKEFFKQRKFNIIGSAIAIILMWLVWIIVYYSVGNSLIVPSFWETCNSFWHFLGSGAFWLALLGSLGRTLLAFAISLIGAVICAVLATLSKTAKAVLKPVMVFLRTLPTMAVILIILKITLGNKTLSPVIVTVLVLLPLIYAQFNAAIGGIDADLVRMCKVYGVEKRDAVFKVYLPLILPNTLSQTGANISLGLKVMISAEVLVNTAKGIGGMMQESSIAAEVANLAALTLAAVILGLILDIGFSQLKRITDKWSKKEGLL